MLGHTPRVVHVVDGAAALARRLVPGNVRQAALIPELHGEPDNGRAGFLQERSHGGAVHAAAHCYNGRGYNSRGYNGRGHGGEAGSRRGIHGAVHGMDTGSRWPAETARCPATTAGITSRARAISSSVLECPKLRRTLALASAEERPMAART